MPTNLSPLIEQLSGELTENAYKASDALGRIGSEEVVNAMINLLDHPNPESRILAARTMSLIRHNEKALIPLLDAVKNKENASIAGDLLMALDGFDVSALYVEFFKLYLFGSFKVSNVAKDLLDFKEFDITPRVIRKAEKHWKHFSSNIKQDEIFELRKKEVEAMLEDLKAYLED